MTAVLLVVLSLTVLGMPVALAVDRSVRPLSAIALGFLYGSGLAYAALLALSPLGWTLPRAAGLLLAVSGGALVIALRSRPAAARPRLRLALPDLLTAVTLIGFGCFVTLAPLWEWDFWAIWGLKARVFAERGAIDWRFLESPWNAFSHPDYQLLVPLNMDLVALANGGWDDRWLGLLFVAFAAAIVLLVRDLAAEEASPNVAASIALAIAATACARRAGVAEGPLIAFGGGALLLLRRAVLFDDRPALRHGALLLGLAACTKNEGLALIVSIAVAMIVSGASRKVPRLWPAVALALPWLIIRSLHRLPSELVSGPLLARVASHLPQLGDIARELIASLARPWLFMAILLALLIARDRRRERFALIAIGIQFALYLATYLATPYDVLWHIGTSWERVSAQLLVPLAYVAAMLVAASFDTLPGHAEARPEL
jgi:hypothetical protein